VLMHLDRRRPLERVVLGASRCPAWTASSKGGGWVPVTQGTCAHCQSHRRPIARQIIATALITRMRRWACDHNTQSRSTMALSLLG